VFFFGGGEMIRSQAVDGLTIESLGLKLDTYWWLTQTHFTFYDPIRGIRSLKDLLCCEAEMITMLPTHKPHLSPSRLREVKQCLAAHGKRLADPIEGPCIPPADGDEWVRLPYVSNKPNWIERRHLRSALISQVIGLRASVLSHGFGVFTIASLDQLTARDILEDIDWQRRNKNGEEYLQRLNTALEGLGLPPVR
jgi:hypothetical protein